MQKFIQIISAPPHLSYETETTDGVFEYHVDVICLTAAGEVVACAFDGDGCCIDVADENDFVRLKFKFPGSYDAPAAGVNAPGLLRISEAARRVGISSELFMEGVQAGEINIDLVKIGARFNYVRSSQLEQFLTG